MMTEAQLYQRCDESLSSLLIGRGFIRAQPAEFLRRTGGGEDRIMVSRGRGVRRRSQFAVFMSYYPDYLKIIDEMFCHLGEDRGFPCGPYLSPVGVIRREKYWSCKNVSVLEKSLTHVKQCLIDVGLPWLETLRNPVVFADEVDPVADLGAGLANEVAGNIELAAGYYREKYSRLSKISATATERRFLNEYARPFIFVSAKLDVDQEKREYFQRKLDYYPNVQKLGGV